MIAVIFGIMGIFLAAASITKMVQSRRRGRD
jgi:type IV secretory pathway VirB2 component (pilin)